MSCADPDHHHNLVDTAAAALEVGHGWYAVEGVDEVGIRSFWLLNPSPVTTVTCRAHVVPRHELTGPLPPDITARVTSPAVPRCGRPRTDGAPCRSLVGAPGDVCAWHRTSDYEAGR